ncbi:hypothetical protein AYO38_00865 [bacterium SCGC AG-212-C10]|nr:hypothetical protein AYO38_00865 [bacterium SCGC AG-212-C10]
MFRRVSRVLVAVSGGADSVACLLVLRRLQERFGFETMAAHFDHQLRPESKQDLEWVREHCNSLGVTCLTGEGDVAAAARERRSGIEATARAMRYQFLGFVAGKERCECVATGHTANDQAETVLQRVLRGSGVRGIRGMLPVATVPGAVSQTLVRPLLGISREQTAAICAEAGITPLADASNEDRSFLRNRIRHDVLPLLRDINPSVDRALVGLAASARESFAPVDRQAMSTQPSERIAIGSLFALASFRALPAEARTLVVEREAAYFSLPFEVNRERVRGIDAVLRAGRGRVLFGEVEVEVSSGMVRIGAPRPPRADVPPTLLNVPGITLAGGWRIQVATDALPEQPGAHLAAIDSEAISGVLRVRTLLPGDHITLRGHRRRVSDTLVNAKVPAWQRDQLLAITDGRGVVTLLGAPASVQPAPGADPWFVRATSPV